MSVEQGETVFVPGMEYSGDGLFVSECRVLGVFEGVAVLERMRRHLPQRDSQPSWGVLHVPERYFDVPLLQHLRCLVEEIPELFYAFRSR